MASVTWRTLLLAGYCLAANGASVSSQTESAHSPTEDAPTFYKDLVVFRSAQEGKSRLEMHLKVPYDELQFLKLDEGTYQASFEISTVVFEEGDFQVDGRIWRDTVTVNSFDATNSRRDFAYTRASFDLNPGKYKIHVGLLDIDTGRSSSQKTAVQVNDLYTAPLSVSDVLLADNVTMTADGRQTPTPQVGVPRREDDKLFAYFEVYSKLGDTRLEVNSEIKNTRNKAVFRDEQKLEKHTTPTTTFVIELPTEKLPHDSYVMHVSAKGGKQTSESEHLFSLRWEGVPASVADLDLAIRQMRYIANKKDLKKMMDATTDRKRWAFVEFWRRVDPSPGTEQNELLDEYYRRINYANTSFGGFQEGWKTDRGMVFVLFGAPNDIDRNPFYRSPTPAAGRGRPIKAYEIWTYYDLNRQFVFLDENGYGDYRLEYPFAIDQYLR